MEYASKFFIANLPDFMGFILALCAEVKKYGRDDYRDGQILANAIIFVFWTGLKASEFLSLKIGDVKYQGTGEILDSISVGNGEIEICGDIKNLIQNHLTYLESSAYKTTRAQPLFPKTRKSSLKSRSADKNLFYDEDTMTSHIRTCLTGNGFSFQRFESIWKAGICSYFIRLKESGEFGPDECLFKTTHFARYRDQKETIGIIKGFIQPEDVDRSSIFDNIPRLSLMPFKNRTWILPHEQYKLCVKFCLPRLLNGGGISVPPYIEDMELMNRIRINFCESLKINSYLAGNEKTELAEYFGAAIQKAYEIFNKWKESR